MRHYQFRLPPGLILPWLLGVLILAFVVSFGLLLIGIVFAALVLIGLGSSIYRILFSSKPKEKQSHRHYVRVGTKTSAGYDDIPFTEYKEIQSGQNRDNHTEEKEP
jgi:hypothetical protein